MSMSALVTTVKSYQEICTFYSHTDWLAIEVNAPREIKIGESFSVTFLLKPDVTLDVDEIQLSISGNIGYNGEWAEWNYTWENMKMYSGADYRATKTFTVSSLSSAANPNIGYVWGKIWASYSDVFGEHYTYWAEFQLTKIYTKTYDEIIVDYNFLNQSYQKLQKENSSLKTSISFYQNLAKAFGIMIVALVFITIYFATRKSKFKTRNLKNQKLYD